MRARRRQAQRPRQCRLYRAPPHVFRDARQFLLRRLFQGDAIELAWNLVTKEFGIADRSPARHRLSRRRRGVRYVEEDRRLPRLPHHPHRQSDNFWAWARSAPAAPVRRFSTIRARRGGRPARQPGEDGDRFLEFWNLVFMQYEQVAGGERVALPRPSIDTGMGLERIAALLQGVHLQLRHRSDAGVDPRRRRSDRCRPPTVRRRRAIASSPIICAPRSFSSPMASCPRTRAAAMCCAASCGAPCATRNCSARASR